MAYCLHVEIVFLDNHFLIINIEAEMKKTIAAHMLDVMEEEGHKVVHIGYPALLDRCVERAGNILLGQLSPGKRNQRILNALEKSPFFKKINGKNAGYTKKNYRCFEVAC